MNTQVRFWKNKAHRHKWNDSQVSCLWDTSEGVQVRGNRHEAREQLQKMFPSCSIIRDYPKERE